MNIQDVIQEQKSERLRNDFNRSNKFRDAVSSIPTNIPSTWDEQVVLYKSGTTYRMYVYLDDTWRYINLT